MFGSKVKGADENAGVVRTYKDVGPLELYSRLTVGTEGAEVRCFNYGLGDPIPGTDRVATVVNTNLPSDVCWTKVSQQPIFRGTSHCLHYQSIL